MPVIKEVLEEITGQVVKTASYPCNSYDDDTLRCMEEMGILLGFRANMAEVRFKIPHLELPREDHANILKEMRAK